MRVLGDVSTDQPREDARKSKGDEGTEGVVNEGGNEEVGVEVDAFEAAFVLENLGKSVDGARVCAVARKEGLNNEARSDEVKRGEKKPGD